MAIRIDCNISVQKSIKNICARQTNGPNKTVPKVGPYRFILITMIQHLNKYNLNYSDLC